MAQDFTVDVTVTLTRGVRAEDPDEASEIAWTDVDHDLLGALMRRGDIETGEVIGTTVYDSETGEAIVRNE